MTPDTQQRIIRYTRQAVECGITRIADLAHKSRIDRVRLRGILAGQPATVEDIEQLALAQGIREADLYTLAEAAELARQKERGS